MKILEVLLVKPVGDTGSDEGRRSDLDNNTFDTIYDWYGYDAGCF